MVTCKATDKASTRGRCHCDGEDGKCGRPDMRQKYVKVGIPFL